MTQYLDSSRLQGSQTYAATGTQSQVADTQAQSQAQTTDSTQSQSTAASIYEKDKPVTETATSSTISFADFKASYHGSSIDSNGVRVGVRAAVVTGILIGADYLFCKGKHVKGLLKVFKGVKAPKANLPAIISKPVESATTTASAAATATATATSATGAVTSTLPSVVHAPSAGQKAFEQALSSVGKTPSVSNTEFLSTIHSKISESAFKNLSTDEINKLAQVIGCQPEEVTHMSKGLYKKLAIKWHPDRNINNPEAHDIFELIGNLYSTAKKA